MRKSRQENIWYSPLSLWYVFLFSLIQIYLQSISIPNFKRIAIKMKKIWCKTPEKVFFKRRKKEAKIAFFCFFFFFFFLRRRRRWVSGGWGGGFRWKLNSQSHVNDHQSSKDISLLLLVPHFGQREVIQNCRGDLFQPFLLLLLFVWV